MKTKKRVLSALAIVLVFVAGYALGLVLDVPNVRNDQLGGTIARLGNYRNTKANEAEIALKNDLLTDKDQREIVNAYINFYYAKAAAFANSLEFAVDQTKAVPAFAAPGRNSSAVNTYLRFLRESRKELLMASLQCQAVENTDPAALRNSLNQANNVIARMNQGNAVVLDYIDQLDKFLQENGTSAYPELSKAHDQLVLDQLGSLLISKDKMLIKYFDKKRMYTQAAGEETFNLKEAMIQDMQKLSAIYPFDMEKLGLWDKEMLGRILDKEELGLKELEELGFHDNEKLGAIFTEREQLGTTFTDAEQLGMGFYDSEQLGILWILDSEKLGVFLADSKQLGISWDSEQLGSIGAFDSEKLGGIISLDAEKLGLLVLLDSDKLGLFNLKIG